MKRVALLAVVACCTVALTTGCAEGLFPDTGPLETSFELSGEAGATADVVLTKMSSDLDGDAKKPVTVTEEDIALPWRDFGISARGDAVLEATPSRGALTCRIVVEGKQVATLIGKAGEKVTCKGIVDE